MLRFVNGPFFAGETRVHLSEDCNRSSLLRLNLQSLFQDVARGGEGSSRTRGIALCSGNHRLIPGRREIETVIDILKIFARRSGKHSFGLGEITVDSREQHSEG